VDSANLKFEMPCQFVARLITFGQNLAFEEKLLMTNYVIAVGRPTAFFLDRRS
jgi:hypothetical protein